MAAVPEQLDQLVRRGNLALEMEFKFCGNVDEAHWRAVVQRLRARGGPGDDAAAGHLPQRLPGKNWD